MKLQDEPTGCSDKFIYGEIYFYRSSQIFLTIIFLSFRKIYEQFINTFAYLILYFVIIILKTFLFYFEVKNREFN